MIGEVSIKTVDAADFEENAIHQKSEVEQEGYMGGKVGEDTIHHTVDYSRDPALVRVPRLFGQDRLSTRCPLVRNLNLT